MDYANDVDKLVDHECPPPGVIRYRISHALAVVHEQLEYRSRSNPIYLPDDSCPCRNTCDASRKDCARALCANKHLTTRTSPCMLSHRGIRAQCRPRSLTTHSDAVGVFALPVKRIDVPTLMIWGEEDLALRRK